MANKFASIYLADAINIINEAALKTMISAQRTLLSDNQSSKVESLQALNDRIAQYNEGVRAAALVIAEALVEKSAEDDKE